MHLRDNLIVSKAVSGSCTRRDGIKRPHRNCGICTYWKFFMAEYHLTGAPS